MTTAEKRKLILRLNKQLVEQAERYAAQRNISVSELVETFFSRLEAAEETEHTSLVRQLTGILPAASDAEETYGRYLLEKYGR
jgi:hypothetical protein